MHSRETTDYLIIGSGLAGLSFASDSVQNGASVRLLDKGRGVGGRMATRRWAETRVDHGPQYFTARGDRLKAIVENGMAEGWLMVWSSSFPLWENGVISSRPAGHPRYAAPLGMSEFAKKLASGRDIVTGATVTALRRTDTGYEATCADGQQFASRRLILTLPPVQMLALARDLLPSETVARLEAVTYFPAWTLLLHLAKDIPGAEWLGIEFQNHPVLGWVSRDHTKRGPDAPPVLVAHGSRAWSAAHLEDDPADVQAALREALEREIGSLDIIEAQTHRWRYALADTLFGSPFFWHRDIGIGGCGDWAGGPKVEGSLESGWGLAAAAAAADNL